MGFDPAGVVRVGDDVLDGEPKLRLDGRWGVGREDAGVTLHDLCEGPEGDSVAVRQATALAPEDHLRAVLNSQEELPDEA